MIKWLCLAQLFYKLLYQHALVMKAYCVYYNASMPIEQFTASFPYLDMQKPCTVTCSSWIHGKISKSMPFLFDTKHCITVNSKIMKTEDRNGGRKGFKADSFGRTGNCQYWSNTIPTAWLESLKKPQKTQAKWWSKKKVFKRTTLALQQMNLQRLSKGKHSSGVYYYQESPKELQTNKTQWMSCLWCVKTNLDAIQQMDEQKLYTSMVFSANYSYSCCATYKQLPEGWDHVCTQQDSSLTGTIFGSESAFPPFFFLPLPPSFPFAPLSPFGLPPAQRERKIAVTHALQFIHRVTIS